MDEGRTADRSEAIDVVVLAASVDIRTARLVVTWLKDVGIRVWLADDDLTLGRDWRPAVTSAMRRASLIVVVVSPDTAGSFVSAEVACAQLTRLDLVPVLVRGDQEHLGLLQSLRLERVKSFDLRSLLGPDGTELPGAGPDVWAERERFLHRVVARCGELHEQDPTNELEPLGSPEAQTPQPDPAPSGAMDGRLAAAVFALFILTVIVAVVADATSSGAAG